jgi:hypothetical protein
MAEIHFDKQLVKSSGSLFPFTAFNKKVFVNP